MTSKTNNPPPGVTGTVTNPTYAGTTSNSVNCSFNVVVFTDWKCETCIHREVAMCKCCGHDALRCKKHDMDVKEDFMCADWEDESGQKFIRPQYSYTVPYNPLPALPNWPGYPEYPDKQWKVTFNDTKKE